MPLYARPSPPRPLRGGSSFRKRGARRPPQTGMRRDEDQAREFLQAGVELIGSPSPAGTAEVLAVLCSALDAAGLETYRVGLGDASLYAFPVPITSAGGACGPAPAGAPGAERRIDAINTAAKVG